MLITAKILLPLIFDNEFDYLIPPQRDFDIGDFVEVPFGNKRIIGVITGFSETIDEKLKGKLKYIICKVSEKNFEIPKLSEKFLEFINRQANYYIQPKGMVLSLCYSQKFFKEQKKIRKEKIKIKKNNIKKVELNKEQQIAYKNILKRFNENKFSVTLIDGVTGSGKTEVFFKLAENLMLENRQSLIMLPEIFLTSQILNRFEERFEEENIAIWHSSITESKKRKYFFDIANGKIKIVIGARSALHLPFKDLGMIVCDEEHDNSYKQDESVIYNARDMAVLKGKIENIPVILSSATPSLETINNVKENKYFCEKLTSRYTDVNMPKIELIDLRKEKLDATKFISDSLKHKIDEVLAQNFQVMLYLNRRGYAPLTLCSNCGYRFKSPDTSAWMVLHYDKSRTPYLMCHHSGYKMPLPDKCPECKTEGSFRACGPGVQRIYEETKLLFPDKKIIEMTSDSLTSKKKADEFLYQIINNEVDIIIGTQIIAKGHHFPKLKMVGVIDADLGLDFIDLRAGEKTFQILQQVSGRAGRETEQGIVMMQSFNPEHIVLDSVRNYDHEKFIEYELQERKTAELPPFSKLAALIISSENKEESLKFSKEVTAHLIQIPDVKIMGPAEAVYFELRGWFRHRILLKSAKNYNIQHYIKKSFENLKIPKNIKLKIDIDPYNFF